MPLLCNGRDWYSRGVIDGVRRYPTGRQQSGMLNFTLLTSSQSTRILLATIKMRLIAKREEAMREEIFISFALVSMLRSQGLG